MKIKVPAGICFLTDWKGFELPNGILNKGNTACGATSLAIENKHKTILLSPRVNLIINKHEQYPDSTFLVYENVSEDEIREYLETVEIPKILATYDAMPRLANIITDKADWRVVVDEYHYILSDSSFKADTEMKLIDSVMSFPYVTYLSATPIADRYMRQLNAFKNLQCYQLVWEKCRQIRLLRHKCKRPIDAALRVVRDYQEGIYPKIKIDGNAVESKECVIFVNSVNNIVNIIKQAGLRPDEVNIIIGKGSEDEVKKIGKGFEVGRIPLKEEPHKKFTFCTSTAYAGCDFYSTCASTFVVSDNKRVHTAVDIATDLVQIAGRQRLAENPFTNILTFIYNVDEGENEKEKYLAVLNEKLEVSEEEAKMKNATQPSTLRAKFIRDALRDQKMFKYQDSYMYYDRDNDIFTVNNLAYMSDRYSYEVQHENYKNDVIVSTQLKDSGFKVGETFCREYKEQLLNLIRKDSFEERMKTYCDYRMNGEKQFFFYPIEQMERKYQDIKEYYKTLGGERIRALGYKKSKLDNEIAKVRNSAYLTIEFRNIFKSGMRLPTLEIKRTMENVYTKYGVHKSGVATHLKRDYGIEIKPCKVTPDNGSRVSGYEIL